MGKIVIGALICASLSLLTSPLRANDADGAMNTAFSLFGFVSTKPVAGKPCIIESTLSEAEYLSAIPTLKRMGILNPDITQTTINMKPRLLEMTFAMEMAPAVARETFDDAAMVTVCQFRQILSDANEYGNNQQRLMFTYKFDRATSKKVNWANFDPRNFEKIASGFKFELWFTREIREELGR